MKTEKPVVSAIIPTYNRSNLLDRAIKSVLNQTYQDLELLVVDDGSEDNTQQLVQQFNDPRIHYIRHEVNKGAPTARNTGIKNSRGKYIAFLDSDDQWLPKKLEKQLGLFFTTDLTNVGLIYTGSLILTEPGGKIVRKQIPSQRGYVFEKMLKQGNIVAGGGSSALIKKSCFDEVGLFHEGLPAGQDHEMWLRISRVFPVDFVKEVQVIKYTEAENRITERAWAKEKRIKFLYENYYTEFLSSLQARKRLAHGLNVAGHYYFLQGSFLKSMDMFLKSIIRYPFSFQIWLRPCLSLLGPTLYRKIYRKLIKLKHRIME